MVKSTEASSVETGGHKGVFSTEDGKSFEIRDVWSHNFNAEIDKIRGLLEDYPYVAMDTEFPGVVAHPVLEYGVPDAQYQTLKCNVDMLKLIQLGITLTDGNGNFAEDCSCWQFNFKFSLEDDIFAEDSIELLKTSGIDFDRFEKSGIDIHYFGELLTMSGLVLNENVTWLTFHSSYDFGYMIKTLTGCSLPQDESGFMEIFRLYFPNCYDLKYMMTHFDGLHGGLSALANSLAVNRIGPMHQAGSDSLLTSQTFFKFMEKFKSYENFDQAKFLGELFGVGSGQKFKKYPTSGGIASASSLGDLSTLNNSGFGNSQLSATSIPYSASSSALNKRGVSSYRNFDQTAGNMTMD